MSDEHDVRQVVVDGGGTAWLDGQQVVIVDCATSRDHNGDVWWTEDAHQDELDDAVDEARCMAYAEGLEEAEYRNMTNLFDQLLEILAPSVLQEAMKQELRSTPLKEALRVRGVI